MSPDPWPNPDTQTLEIRIASERGEAVANDWIAGRTGRPHSKFTNIPEPRPPVTFIAADRTFRELQDIQHGSVPATDLPDGDAIYATGPDTRRNATVITVEWLSDPLLQALAARYGTEALVIRVDPDRPRISY
jgi:hypothetical protein